jgi:hypothetical protein
MSNLSTFYKPAITRADLGLGTANNVTFASIQNTPIGSTTASTVAATNLSASGTVSGTGFSNYLAAPPAIGNTTPAEGTFTTLTLADGTRLLPSFFFADDTNTGFFRRGADTLTFVSGGASRFEIGNQGPRLSSNDFLAWALNGDLTGSSDLALHRDAADTLAQRRSTTAQTFNIYNTFTSATNHERGFLRWSSNVFQIGTEKGSGGGTARDLVFQTDGTTRVTIGATTGQLSSQNSRFVVDDANSAVHVGNTPRISLYGASANQQLAVGNAVDIRWSNTGRSDQSTSFNISLARDADGILAQRAGATAQTWRIYNTVSGTGNVNFDRVNFRWSSNEFIIDTEAGGTGTLRGIKIGSATSSLLGFYGATPVDQPAAVGGIDWDVDGNGGAIGDQQDTEARAAIFKIRARLQELGLIAT